MRPTQFYGGNCRNFWQQYPQIKVDYDVTEIVAECFDAGTRSGERVAKDMTAVRMKNMIGDGQAS